MSLVFRARFVAALRNTRIKRLDKSFYNSLFKNPWVVYAKRPFGGPKQVSRISAGRYTHARLLSPIIASHQAVTETDVTFRYKDYRDQSKIKSLTLRSQRIYPQVFNSAHSSKSFSPYSPLWNTQQQTKTKNTSPQIHQQLRLTSAGPETRKEKDWKIIKGC